MGLDNNGGEGGRLGAQISKVKSCLLYGFTRRIEYNLHGKYLSYKHFNMI